MQSVERGETEAGPGGAFSSGAGACPSRGARNDRTSPQPLVLFCFGLFWSTRRTNAFCSALPPGYTEVVQESRGDGGAAAGQGSGGRLGPAPHRPGLAGRRRPVGGGIKQKSEVSPTKSALLEVGASRFARPVHSQRADGIDALHRAFASRPYGPCTCLGADLLCAVRLLHPLASPLTSTTNPPTQLSVPAMRAKPQVLVHAMGAETTEVLVVCSEHVGSAQELANAMPCSRSKYRLF